MEQRVSVDDDLAQAWAACRDIPTGKFSKRVQALCELGAYFRTHGDMAQSEACFDAALTFITAGQSFFEMESAMDSIAGKTHRVSDIRHLELINNELNIEVVRSNFAITLVQAYHRIGASCDAERCLRQSLERDPEQTEYSTRFAEGLALIGRIDEAIAVKVSLDKKEECMRKIARICLQTDHSDVARELYQETWQRYCSAHVDENGSPRKAIVWNAEDCRNLITEQSQTCTTN